MNRFVTSWRAQVVCISVLAAVAVGGCAGVAVPRPVTFNQNVVVAELSITALAKSCTNMLRDKVIAVATAVRCKDTVETAADAVDMARAVGPEAGADRLAAAQALIKAFRDELTTREVKP